jgi:hypothetical protein
MKVFSKLLIILISSVLATVTLPVYAGVGEAVGQIEFFNDLPVSFAIKRNNKKILGKIGSMELIYGSDEIEVLKVNNYIGLNWGEKQININIGKNLLNEPIDYSSLYKVSPEAIPYSSTARAGLTSISDWASKFFTLWNDDDLRKIKYFIRGISDLQIPLLGVDEKVILENKNLYLVWKGGERHIESESITAILVNLSSKNQFKKTT